MLSSTEYGGSLAAFGASHGVSGLGPVLLGDLLFFTINGYGKEHSTTLEEFPRDSAATRQKRARVEWLNRKSG